MSMPQSANRPARAIHGVLALDKPIGLSSFAALARARHLLGADKAGHGGTLDPLASGVLPLCFGAATKFAFAALEADKTYEAEVCFGTATNTDDAEGEIIAQSDALPSEADLRAALPDFCGTIEQIPPLFSALKKDGQPLYRLARAGLAIATPAPRRVQVHSLTLLGVECVPSAPATIRRARLLIACGTGFYVRALARDLGQSLHCPAHLSALRRTQAAGLTLAQSVPLADLTEMPPEQRRAHLLPCDALLAALPILELDDAQTQALLRGLALSAAPHWPGTAALLRVYGTWLGQRTLLGSAQISDGTLRATRLLSSTELSDLSAAAKMPA